MKKKNKPNIIVPQQKKAENTVSQPSKPIRESGESDNIPTFSLTNQYALGILIVLIGVMAFWILKDFLLQKNTFAFLDIGSDTLNAVFPFNKLAADFISEVGFPTWSFRQGMGQDITPLYNSPLYYLLFLGKSENIPANMVYVELFRIFLNGLVFFWYLKTIKYNNYTSILGSICFTFMGFIALVLGWGPLLADWLLLMVLMLISLEHLLQNKSWYLLPITTFLMAINQPFNLVLVAEFSLIYLLVRLYTSEKLGDWLENGKLAIKLVGFGGLGIGMGALMVYAHITTMLNSPRGSGDVAYTNMLSSQPIFQMAEGNELYTSFLRWFGNDIVGNASNFRLWQNYMEAPAFYVGLGILLLLPQLFVFSNRRQRIAYGSVAGLVLFIMVFPFFRYAFWLFTGNYYRVMAAFIAIGAILGSLKVIEEIIKGFKVNLIVLGATLAFLLFLLFYGFSTQLSTNTELINLLDFINKPIRTSVVLFLLIQTFVLAITRANNLRNIALWAFLGISVIELGYFDSMTLNKREILKTSDFNTRTGFNDYTKEAIEYLNKTDKSFYRVEKGYASGMAVHSSLNDAMIQGYNSTSNYYSFNHRSYVAFAKGLDAIQGNDETSTRWVSGVRGRQLLLPLATVKYYLVKGQNPFQPQLFDSLTTIQDVKVFKTKNHLPMGFTYDKYLIDSTFKRFSMIQKDFSTMQGFIINEKDKAKFKDFVEVKDSVQTLTIESYNQFVSECKTDTLAISSHSDTHFDGTIDLDKTKLLYLSIPFDAGWKAEVDGKPTEIQKVTFGMSGIILDKGKHTVKLRYEAPYFKTGSMISMISIGIFALLFGFTFWRNRKENKVELSENNDV
ncbi:MAG: YfhO family protein [Spirosomaceae bacterium]|nr:YfhO family protein [Spirosomataceae bacterium]